MTLQEKLVILFVVATLAVGGVVRCTLREPVPAAESRVSQSNP